MEDQPLNNAQIENQIVLQEDNILRISKQMRQDIFQDLEKEVLRVLEIHRLQVREKEQIERDNEERRIFENRYRITKYIILIDREIQKSYDKYKDKWFLGFPYDVARTFVFAIAIAYALWK